MKKAILLVMCAILLCGASVLGTLAYLTSTDSVTNTFTVGNVAITMDETDVDINGAKDGETRVKSNEYKLIPGVTYTKDPTIHVGADSEDAWLFVKVENGIAALEASDNTIAAQLTANGWTLVEGTTNVYAYNVKATAKQDITVFNTFAIDGSVTGETLKNYTDAKIVVTAYAVQAQGFDTAAAAWTASGFDTTTTDAE